MKHFAWDTNYVSVVIKQKKYFQESIHIHIYNHLYIESLRQFFWKLKMFYMTPIWGCIEKKRAHFVRVFFFFANIFSSKRDFRKLALFRTDKNHSILFVYRPDMNISYIRNEQMEMKICKPPRNHTKGNWIWNPKWFAYSKEMRTLDAHNFE